MFRSLVHCLLFVAIFSAGCAQSQPVPVEGPDDVRESLLSTARSIHDEPVTDVSAPEQTIGGGSGINVTLASGEPTSTEPFAVMSALMSGVPGKSDYRVTYFVIEPKPEYPEFRRVYSYGWDAQSGLMVYSAGEDNGASNTLVELGAAPAVDANYIQEVGTGEEELPRFEQPPQPGVE